MAFENGNRKNLMMIEENETKESMNGQGYFTKDELHELKEFEKYLTDININNSQYSEFDNTKGNIEQGGMDY